MAERNAREQARLEAAADALLRRAPERAQPPVTEELVSDEEARAALTYWLNRQKRNRETVAEARERLGLTSGPGVA